MAEVDANRAAQREIYGEPLGDVVDRCRATLGLTQARVAELLGMSAPMLSQVVTGHRIKIGNPVAVERLRAMVDACDEVERGHLGVEQALSRVEAVAATGDGFTGTSRRTSSGQVAEQVQAAFRRVASAGDFLAAADDLEAQHPGIARLLRALGAGRRDEAVAVLHE